MMKKNSMRMSGRIVYPAMAARVREEEVPPYNSMRHSDQFCQMRQQTMPTMIIMMMRCVRRI